MYRGKANTESNSSLAKVLSEREPRTPEIELELLSATTALLEHEGMSPSKGVPVVVLRLFMRIRIVAPIETRAQLWVAQHLICLVNSRHLFLSLFLGETLFGGLVWVVHLGQLAVSRLDLTLVGVVCNPENLVVVLVLATFERDLRLLHEWVNSIFLPWVCFGRLAKCVNAGFVFFGVKEVLGAIEQAVEGVLVVLKGFLAVFLGFLAI